MGLQQLFCALYACRAGPNAEINPYSVLEIDMGPFNRNFPRLNMASYIGQGVTFLNRHLSSSMFQVSMGHIAAVRVKYQG